MNLLKDIIDKENYCNNIKIRLKTDNDYYISNIFVLKWHKKFKGLNKKL